MWIKILFIRVFVRCFCVLNPEFFVRNFVVQHFFFLPHTPREASKSSTKKNELLYKFVGINVDKILSILFTYPIFVEIHSRTNTTTTTTTSAAQSTYLLNSVFAERGSRPYCETGRWRGHRIYKKKNLSRKTWWIHLKQFTTASSLPQAFFVRFFPFTFVICIFSVGRIRVSIVCTTDSQAAAI